MLIQPSYKSQMAQAYATGDETLQICLTSMYKATADDRGTVQGLARELDDATADGKLHSLLVF